MTAQQTLATAGRSTVPLIAPRSSPTSASMPRWSASIVAHRRRGGLPDHDGLRRLHPALRRAAHDPGRHAGAGDRPVAAGERLAARCSRVGAFVGGLGQAISTPSSSHLLGRLAPPRIAPLVFSIKQTGVPAGLMLAGVVSPRWSGLERWRTALIVFGGDLLPLRVVLQPLRRRFDVDREPGPALSPADVRANMTRGAARAGAARPVRGDVRLRRPAVAVHRLLRALPRARPGLRRSNAPAWCSRSPSPSRCPAASSGAGSPRTWCGRPRCWRCWRRHGGGAVLAAVMRRPGRPGSPPSPPAC